MISVLHLRFELLALDCKISQSTYVHASYTTRLAVRDTFALGARQSFACLEGTRHV